MKMIFSKYANSVSIKGFVPSKEDEENKKKIKRNFIVGLVDCEEFVRATFYGETCTFYYKTGSLILRWNKIGSVSIRVGYYRKRK